MEVDCQNENESSLPGSHLGQNFGALGHYFAPPPLTYSLYIFLKKCHFSTKTFDVGTQKNHLEYPQHMFELMDKTICSCGPIIDIDLTCYSKKTKNFWKSIYPTAMFTD